MTAMAGIIVSLVGLGIVIVASVSFVYPLPGLTTQKRRKWAIAFGFLVLLVGNTVIQHTVPEDLREPFVGPVLSVPFLLFILAGIALIRPLPKLWLPTRKRAGYVGGLAFALLLAGSPLVPEPPPPTPEELAEQAAKEKRRKVEAEARRKAKETEAEAERRAEERERAVQEVEDRREAIRDWGADHQSAAKVRCDDHIEQRAQYDFEWTQGWGGRIFSQWIAHDPENPSYMFPPITESTILVYSGDKIRFQNGFGAFRNYTYDCYYHPESETVIKVTVSPGKLNQ